MQTGSTDYIDKNDVNKFVFYMGMGNIKIWLKEHNQIKF